MANRERGEVSLVINDHRYTLRPTFTAYCELEDRLDMTHAEVARQAARGSMRMARALVWSYLQACHADEIDTFEKAGELLDEAGLDYVQEQLAVLDALNAPKAPTGTSTQKTATRPQKAQTETTGGPLSLPVDAPA